MLLDSLLRSRILRHAISLVPIFIQCHSTHKVRQLMTLNFSFLRPPHTLPSTQTPRSHLPQHNLPTKPSTNNSSTIHPTTLVTCRNRPMIQLHQSIVAQDLLPTQCASSQQQEQASLSLLQ